MSKKTILLLPLLLVFMQFNPARNVEAADLELTGSLNGYYYSAEDIYTQGATTVEQGSSVTLSTPNTVTINPGFHVVLSGTLSINRGDTDSDGLLDFWEMLYFGNLVQGPDDDPDSDGLTNLEEFQLGTNPSNPDTDNDEMPDGWEKASGTNPIVYDRNDDLDADLYSNYIEYILDTDPGNGGSSPVPGCHHKYDDKGRLINSLALKNHQIDYEIKYTYDMTGNRSSRIIR
jgi:hypothetical protein